jgi:hypothetical protein
MKRTGVFVGLALTVLLTPACGQKGPLQMPLVLVPQKVETFKAFQRGSRIFLEWTNPETYIDGRPLTDLSDIEVWLHEIPDQSKSNEKAPSAEGFEVKSRRIAVLEQPEKPPRPEKSKPKKNAPVAQAKRKGPGAKELVYAYALSDRELKDIKLVFSLRVEDERKKRYSDFSEPVAIVPRRVPGPPPHVRFEVFADRVEIRWDAPAANFDGSKPASISGYNVYRLDKAGAIVRLNTALTAETFFADKGAVFGQAYRYLVRASASAAEPYLESDDSPVVDVLPKDVYPPAVPTGLSAAIGPDFITLIWDAGKEKDLAGYYVWRKDEGQSVFVRLTQKPLLQHTYSDRSVEKGRRYEYAITAVDELGNESAKSAAVAEIIKDP